MKKVSLSIGLPVYNEGANLMNLLADLKRQKKANYSLKRIIISSDGSTDNTKDLIKKVKGKKILLINNRKRKGIKRGLNQILKRSDSDILLFLDGDIRIYDQGFVEKIISPIVKGRGDLTSCRIKPQETPSFFSKIIYKSMNIKDIIFDNFNNGDNIYTCHGPVRAYSKRLYKNLTFPLSVGNDMYSYFHCKTMGYSYRYVKSTTVFYKLVESLQDHAKQSIRFRVAKEKIAKHFADDLVHREFKKPLIGFSKNKSSIIRSILSNPLLSFSYFVVNVYLNLLPIKPANAKEAWDISTSSK
jgi:glycosyltransferase involved in cell wall biosynthesis